MICKLGLQRNRDICRFLPKPEMLASNFSRNHDFIKIPFFFSNHDFSVLLTFNGRGLAEAMGRSVGTR